MNKLTVEEIKKILSNKEVYNKLKIIGQIRNRIWYLHRQVYNLEIKVSKMQIELQEELGTDFPGLLGLSIFADGIYEKEMKNMNKNKDNP